MKHITHSCSVFIALLMLSFPVVSQAVEFLDANVPVSLKNAYYGRYRMPNTCIESTERYISDKQGVKNNTTPVRNNLAAINKGNVLPVQLLAFCYSQVEDYQQTYQLLSQLLKDLDFSPEQLRTLNLIASEIPEAFRPNFSNQTLINTFTGSLQKMEKSYFADSPSLKTKLLLTISNLSLDSDQYRSANIALAAAKEVLNKHPNEQLKGWLAYYYGIYYAKINQQQLAISNLFAANKIATKHHFTQLSGETKKSIADLYQQKHLFNRAIDFASQRVELYMKTKNTIKQADSLIQLAILKEKNKEKNQSLIYLFNALELIQDKKHSELLAHVYLELGRTYSSYVINKDYQKERLLAQKYLHNARNHFTRLKDVRYQIESLLLLAQLNIINEDPALAILQLENILKLSTNNYPELRVRAFDMLASSYELTGNHQQAIVHFKNFHSLQNRIKERLFALQQLQINEQLQLIERTQQQRQLEIENNVLKKSNSQFKSLSYGTLLLLIIIILSLIKILFNHRKLVKAENRSQRLLNFHPRTKLPAHKVKGDAFNYSYYGEPLYYALINIPFLSQLNMHCGLFFGAKLEAELGQNLLDFFTENVSIFQVRDNQILFISEQKDHDNAQDFAQKIELFFIQFTDQHNLPNMTSIGIVAFPFLNNVSRAITPIRMLNLTSLALFGASQLRDEYQQNSWLELYAIDNLQPAFFDGDLWLLGQKAIQKGIVKINSSHQNHQIDWPVLKQ